MRIQITIAKYSNFRIAIDDSGPVDVLSLSLPRSQFREMIKNSTFLPLSGR